MNSDFIRLVFSAICAAGIVAIAVAAVFERGRLKRGVSALSARHFRWRMVSALLWILILASLGTATLFFWPPANLTPAQLSPAQLVSVRRFTGLVSGAMVLLMLAIVIMTFDFYFTLLAQKRATLEFSRDRAQKAREEIERATKRGSE